MKKIKKVIALASITGLLFSAIPALIYADTTENEIEVIELIEKIVYRTREDNGYTYDEWGEWSSTVCTGDANTCESIQVYSKRTPIYSNYSNWSTTTCTVGELCQEDTIYRTRSTKSKVITAQCVSGTFVNVANAVQGSCATYGTCPSGSIDGGSIGANQPTRCYTCWASQTECSAATGGVCTSNNSCWYHTSYYNPKPCANYNYTYNCSGIAYYHPTYQNNCTVGVSGTNCVVTENYTTTSCPDDTTEIDNTCYTAWEDWTTTSCDVGNTCESTTGYRTRTIDSYSNWSDWSLEECSGDTTVCKTQTQYRTKTATKQYTEWSDWSDTVCDVTDTEHCESKTISIEEEPNKVKINISSIDYNSKQNIIGVTLNLICSDNTNETWTTTQETKQIDIDNNARCTLTQLKTANGYEDKTPAINFEFDQNDNIITDDQNNEAFQIEENKIYVINKSTQTIVVPDTGITTWMAFVSGLTIIGIGVYIIIKKPKLTN